MGPSFPLLPLGWLGARRACCSLRRPHHWPGTEGDPRPRGPPTQPSESPTCASWGPRPPWEPARPPCAPEVRAPARASCELTPAPRLLHGGWAPVSVHCTGERGCLRGCVPRPSLLRGCPVAAQSAVQGTPWLGARPPCLGGTTGTGPPFHRLTSSSGGGRGCGDWRAPGPPDLCPLPRWRPRSLRTWWSTTRAPGTPACWPQTASCPSCSASLTAASTAWPSSQVPSRGLSPRLAAGLTSVMSDCLQPHGL